MFSIGTIVKMNDAATSKPRPNRRRLARMKKLLDRQEERFIEAVRQAFPTGSIVEWTHGRHVRAGRVLRLIGDTDRRCARFVVRSESTGREYDIHVGTVLLWELRER